MHIYGYNLKCPRVFVALFVAEQTGGKDAFNGRNDNIPTNDTQRVGWKPLSQYC